jgi:hypothetical protein
MVNRVTKAERERIYRRAKQLRLSGVGSKQTKAPSQHEGASSWGGLLRGRLGLLPQGKRVGAGLEPAGKPDGAGRHCLSPPKTARWRLATSAPFACLRGRHPLYRRGRVKPGCALCKLSPRRRPQPAGAGMGGKDGPNDDLAIQISHARWHLGTIAVWG